MKYVGARSISEMAGKWTDNNKVIKKYRQCRAGSNLSATEALPSSVLLYSFPFITMEMYFTYEPNPFHLSALTYITGNEYNARLLLYIDKWTDLLSESCTATCLIIINYFGISSFQLHRKENNASKTKTSSHSALGSF